MTAENVIEEGFEKAEARMAALRITPAEFTDRAEGVPYHSYRRARRGDASVAQRTKLLRKVEAELDRMETEKDD